MKKILIALDYDPTAEKIAKTGYALATAMKAEVVLVHVIAEPAYYSSMEYSIMGFTGFMGFSDVDIPVVVDELKKESQRFLDQSKEHLGDASIKTRVMEGVFADSILEAAKSESADIIVMGSHGRGGLDKLIMGSVAEKVLHHSSVPLFIIPTKEFEKKS
jgi:nucleotide-binding universal stress UspA family protein